MKGLRSKVLSFKRNPDAFSPPAEGPMVQRSSSNADTLSSTSHGMSNMNRDIGADEPPEDMAARLVRVFCMSDADESGAEVALLPSIVEAAESSPQAAGQCARYIRKFMYREYWSRPSYVYNAIMLMRILVENPGLTFTRNIDKKFVDTVRSVLRGCKTAHVVVLLMETLDYFETRGAVDEGLGRIVEMWQTEKSKSMPAHTGQSSQSGQGRVGNFFQRQQPQHQQPHPNEQFWQQQQGHRAGQDQFGGGSTGRGGGSGSKLPKPRELKKRLDEAKTTAGVLADIVNTSNTASLMQHDLADDLSVRCRRATLQVLEYLNMRDPAPDNEEMASLLTTHEILQQSLHHYHRAVLEARKQLGIGEATRISESGEALTMTPAGKGKGAIASNPSSSAQAGEPSANSDAVNSPNEANSGGKRQAENHRARPDATVLEERSIPHAGDDDVMLAAALAASTALGSQNRNGSRLPAQDQAGPASEAENPFADSGQNGSSRSSSRVRHATGTAAGSVLTTASDNDSDEEYLRSQHRKLAAKSAMSRSATGKHPPSAGTDTTPVSPWPGSDSDALSREGDTRKPPTALPGKTARRIAGGSSSSASQELATAVTSPMDAAANTKYQGDPVYRY